MMDKRSLVFIYDMRSFTMRDGGVVECSGRDGVQQWLELALRTRPSSAPIYAEIEDNTAFGVSVAPLIGNRMLPSGFVQAELERQITEVCALNPYIASVGNFVFSGDARRTLNVQFDVTTQDGTTEEVEIDL
ncbi:MAG: DUF2634 domain-containing protein [Eubacteriales bacterium]|nr:DUF2634 domain-containing protein [Eubacteriales bacterium]